MPKFIFSNVFTICNITYLAWVHLSKIIALVIPWLMWGQTDSLYLEVADKLVTPRHYVVPYTEEELEIDGLSDDPAWKNSRFSDKFVDIEGHKEARYDTRVKMLWSRNYLYIFSHLKEPHIWGNLRQRDTVIFYNNDFEVFLDPSNDTRNYAEIEINALGTVWDLLLDKPYRVGGRAINQYNIDGLKTAVNIKGTLNNPTDVDTAWTVELAIPMEALAELKAKPRSIPEPGEVWRINFSRVEWDHDILDGRYDRKKVKGKYLPEMNWVWSPQGVVNMHEPEKWGYLHFVNSLDDHVDLTVSDSRTFQIAYALFREFRFLNRSQLQSMETGETLVLLPTEHNKRSIILPIAKLTKTLAGFEISFYSGSTKKFFVIDQDGHLRAL